MSHPTLDRHLKRRNLRPLYLFFGEEEFLIERALKGLEAALTGEFGEPPLKSAFTAPEITLEDFLAQAKNAPLWAAGQLLVLRRVEAYPDLNVKALAAYLDRPAPRSLVVLVSPGLKNRDVGKHPVWSRLQREEAALGFFRLREEELLQWLTREAKGLGKTLSLAAAQRLVEMVGDNLAELTQELGKLALFAGEEATLTPSLVSRLASHSRHFNIFALVEALGEAGAAKRLAALDHLLELGEAPAKILNMLARQVRLLIRYKEAGPQAPPAELATALNLAPYLVKKLGQQAKPFTLDSLRRHLALLHQADLRLKTSTGSPRLWLEWTLLQMGPG